MKKAFTFCLVVLVCLSCFVTAYAATGEQVAPLGIVALSSGMPKVAGTTNQYNPFAVARPGVPEQVSVGFTLYKIVDGSEVYVASASKSGNSNYVRAEKFVNLSAGTYKLYAYYQGTTNADGSVTTYVI